MSQYNYTSAKELIKLLKTKKIKLIDFILKRELKLFGNTSNKIYNDIEKYFLIMKESVNKGLQIDYKSYCFDLKCDNLKNLKNPIMSELEYKILISAIAVSINSSNMGKIIACPTAGSCGIFPGCIIPVTEKYKLSESQIFNSIIIAGEVGRLIAQKTSISGAAGGCMAECGVASAMASSAIVYLFDGSIEQIFNSAALSLKNNLGLTCDPVAGLVEVPCIKRNGFKAIEALTAAQLSLAGVKSAIPLDEVVECVVETSDDMSKKYKETSTGGLAVTPTALKIKKTVLKEKKYETK